METLQTYKFYNEEGERLGIFCEDLGPELHIIVIPCRKGDQFSSKTAKLLYGMYMEGQEVLAETYRIPTDEGKSKATFMKFCNVNFFKLKTEIYTVRGAITSVKKVKSEFHDCFSWIEVQVLKKKQYIGK